MRSLWLFGDCSPTLPPPAGEKLRQDLVAPHLGVPKSSASSPDDSPAPDSGGDHQESEKGSVFDRMFRGRKKK